MLRTIFLSLLLITPVFAADPDFVTSYWFGPPPQYTTLERYKEIKEANFTVALPSGGGMTVEQNRKMLDHCQAVGLKAIIWDSRIAVAINNDPKIKASLDAMIKDYKDHPALFGYFIADEPGAGAFPGLGEVVAYLKEKDPTHPGYINLLPTYARDFNALGTKTYEEYVRQYAQIVKPFAISYDHYHFTNHGDRSDFFENLDTVRKVALEHKIPFWNIVLCTQHGDYRNLTEPELRYEAMQTLAYGGKGVLWFTYWSPEGYDATTVWAHAMINKDGSRDPHYDMIKRVNAEVLALAKQLKGATSTDVKRPAEKDPQFNLGTFKSKDGAALLVAASLDTTRELSARIPVTGDRAEQFNPTSQKWSPLGIQEIEGKKAVAVTISPGGATLVRCR
ncbi:MAG TPA: hypothetical protein VF669_16665 [Tepidisphaeraceae bacterium]|jgi:hypothetical protein